jgi:hypothetical protein
VICEFCQAESQLSQVFPGGQTVTLMGYQPYYDESGNFHDHDPNWRTSYFRCSRGHEWTTCTRASCPTLWCDWNKDENLRRETKRVLPRDVH